MLNLLTYLERLETRVISITENIDSLFLRASNTLYLFISSIQMIFSSILLLVVFLITLKLPKLIYAIIYAIIFVLTKLVLFCDRFPLLLYFACGFFVYPSVRGGIAIIISLVISRLSQVCGMARGSCINAEDVFIGYVKQQDKYKFTEISLEKALDFNNLIFQELSSNKLLYSSEKIRSLFKLPVQDKPIRIFFVNQLRPPFDTAIKSFVNPLGTSYIFIKDPKIKENPFAKFTLLHEIGHVSSQGELQWSYEYSFHFHGSIAGAIMGLNSIFDPSLVFPLSTLYILLRVPHFVPARHSLHREIFADGFALKYLTHEEAKTVLDNLNIIWGNLTQKKFPSFWERKRLKVHTSLVRLQSFQFRFLAKTIDEDSLNIPRLKALELLPFFTIPLVIYFGLHSKPPSIIILSFLVYSAVVLYRNALSYTLETIKLESFINKFVSHNETGMSESKQDTDKFKLNTLNSIELDSEASYISNKLDVDASAEKMSWEKAFSIASQYIAYGMCFFAFFGDTFLIKSIFLIVFSILLPFILLELYGSTRVVTASVAILISFAIIAIVLKSLIMLYLYL